MPKSQGYLISVFRESKKGGIKRGKGAREGTGSEGEGGGENDGKGWEERGPKAHSKKSDFGTPMI